MARAPLRAPVALLLAAAVAVAVGDAAAQAPPTSCTLQLDGAPQTFDRCMTIQGIGDAFQLFWTVGSGGGVTWGMSTASSSGYVALGFPTQPAEMPSTYAFALQACSSCDTGAQVRQYWLGGTASGEVEPTDFNFASSLKAATIPGGGMAGTFTTQPLPIESNLTALPLIFASGAVYSNGRLRQHGEYGSGLLDLTSGTLSDSEVDSKAISALVAAHLWLMLIGWGVCIPLGVVVARTLRQRDPLWFKLHRALQTLGLLLGIIGFALGFVVSGGWAGIFQVHRNLGLAVTIFGLVQLPALVPRWRPKLTSPRRRLFNLWHWWIGRIAVVLAVANIYYGLIDVLDVSAGAWAAYTAVLGVIVGAMVLKESYDYLQLPPPGAPVEGGVGGVASGSGVTPSGSQQEVALAAVDGAEAKNV